MKSARDLTGHVLELVAQRPIRERDSGIDGGPGRLWLPAGLEMHVIQQCRFGEISLQNFAGAMHAPPPPDKMQQVVCVKAKTPGRQAAYVLECSSPWRAVGAVRLILVVLAVTIFHAGESVCAGAE